MMALFRIVELSQGMVKIDNRDISSIPLRQLRANLAIIPQDPVLFTGDIRFQLDPFQQYSDESIWEVLKQVNLAEMVIALPRGLNEYVVENGENLSQGQKQLLCIARALLKQAKILIVDEGTSAVDPYTDELIQQVLRQQVASRGTTVLAIAHRLQTIIDFDRILVLGQGTVLEYDSPNQLIANPQSVFSQMLRESNLL
jgi:ABC-type multidrug transport system fused ATPase/permease subunit